MNTERCGNFMKMKFNFMNKEASLEADVESLVAGGLE